MKSIKIKLMMFSALCVGSVTFAQKSEVNTEKSTTIAEMAAKEDSAAIVAANKKRAAEEKAKLPKPYDATENAEAKIAELVKKAKAENKNTKVFAKYDNPGAKFGYPVFIVLDQNGKMIHTQDSAVLEEGKGYSTQKVKEFFLKWTTKS